MGEEAPATLRRIGRSATRASTPRALRELPHGARAARRPPLLAITPLETVHDPALAWGTLSPNTPWSFPRHQREALRWSTSGQDRPAAAKTDQAGKADHQGRPCPTTVWGGSLSTYPLAGRSPALPASVSVELAELQRSVGSGPHRLAPISIRRRILLTKKGGNATENKSPIFCQSQQDCVCGQNMIESSHGRWKGQAQ
jgi:hypothetical protein